MSTYQQVTMKPKQSLTVLGLGIAVSILIIGAIKVFPFGPDWTDAFYPAARRLLSGKNPYDIEDFMYVPWSLIPVIPLGLFPVKVGGALFLVLSMAGFAVAAYRMGASPSSLGAFMISPPVVHCLLNGNYDWMPLLGFTLPPRIGIFLAIIKPQIGFPVIFFWIVEAWRTGGWREVLRVSWPAALAFLISLLLFGWWPLKWLDAPSFSWNASLFPWTIPLGIWLMYSAIIKRDIRYAMPAGACLSPYIVFHSWSSALLPIASKTRLMIALSFGLWAMIVLRGVLV